MVKELSQEFYQNKRETLYDLLPDQSAAIIGAGCEVSKSLDENYPFYVNNNYLYLTG